MNDQAPIRCGLYVRLSQDRAGNELGVQRQEAECRELADHLGWPVVEVYADNDRSATSGKRRPAYERLLAALDAGDVNAIIAWHPDRLYRRVVDLGELVDVCKRNNVQIATVKAGAVDLTTPTGRLVAGLLAQVATYEVEHKTERWRSSFVQAREQGRFVRFGRRTFGYTSDGELVDDEAAVAREVAADVLAGRGLVSICDELDRRGVRTTRGNPWTPTNLRGYLTNPRITALMTAYGEVVGEGDWTPILDRDTWETVVAVLDAIPRTGPRSTPRVALLGGLLLCGVCGVRMMTSSDHGGRRRYQCVNRPGRRGCGGPSIYADMVEDYVEAWARERLTDDRVAARVAELRDATGSAALLDEIAGAEARLVELDAELDKPGVPVERITRAIVRLTSQLEDARRRLADVTEATAAAADAALVVRVGSAGWPDDLAQRRRLVAVALGDERVFVDPARRRGPGFDEGRIRFAVPDQEAPLPA